MKHLLVLNRLFWRYRWRLLSGIGFVALANYFSVLQPRMVRYALDEVIANMRLYPVLDGFSGQEVLGDSIGEQLLFFGGLVLTFALMMGIFMFFMRWTIIVMSRLMEYDIRKEIYDHYQQLTTAFYKRNSTGDLMSRITEDVSKVRMYLGPAILYGINLITLFILVIQAMIQVSPMLTLFSLLPLPILSISIYYVSDLINRKSGLIQKQLSFLNTVAQEVYSGIRVVKSYVQEKAMVRYFADESETFKVKALDLAKVDALFFPFMVLMIGVSTIVTIYVGGLQVFSGQITTGNIGEFVIYVNMLTWPVTSIGWVASIIQQADASQQRINEFLATEPDLVDGDHPMIELKGEIQCRNMSFTYPDTGIEALKNVSFSLKAGQKLAVVGRTGSGKSTLAELLLRMYDISSGELLLDGRPIHEWRLADLRDQIGYVPQDVFLFSDTVAANIAFGHPGADQAAISSYAGAAAVAQDIERLPNTYDTLVGERGVTLSGGQKQRISLARALIKQPRLIILDDCLSAVDTDTEKQILQHIDEEIGQSTAIVITHRITSMIDFDHILVLDQGQVVEQGTHADLLALKGAYAELYEHQLLESEQEGMS
ncbi:MAG: ABC transporter ATP-binding protein/permease [Saprospiraceae bacterium]|nr:ABC transporter ATP-binding protein/permease [Saprospiraceae bacterium]